MHVLEGSEPLPVLAGVPEQMLAPGREIGPDTERTARAGDHFVHLSRRFGRQFVVAQGGKINGEGRAEMDLGIDRNETVVVLDD